MSATGSAWAAKVASGVQSRAAELNREIPELVSSLFRRAIALGHGERDIATVMQVLRAG